MGNHTSGKKVKHIFHNSNIVPCKCNNFVLIVAPGQSSEAHLVSSADDPAESTKKKTRDEQETTLASRNRLHDLPEWLEEFTDNMMHTRSTSSGSNIRDPTEPPSPHPLPAKGSKGKHNLFTHCPGDPNCEIRKHTKVTRAACRRNSQSHISFATKFGDIKTADHNVVKEEGELRNHQSYANCCPQWISKLPMQNKTITRNGQKSRKSFDLEENPKDIFTNDSLTFGKAGEDLQWNHCSSAPHRPETNGIAERAIRSVKEGTSSVLL